MKRAIPVDEKLAYGLTMAEVRAILRTGQAPAAACVREEANPVRTAFKPVLFRFATGRRPDASYVERLVNTVDGILGQAPGTVYREAEDLSPDKGRPRHSRRYLTLTPSTSDPGCRSLLASCLSLDIDPAALSLCQVPMFEVELHAIERFHLRTRSGLVRDALASFGAGALRDIALFRVMVEVADEQPNKSFAVPFADGLVLGHACAPHPAAVRPHTTIQLFGDSTYKSDSFLAGTDGSCRIATFLGPLEMSPERERLRTGLIAIAAESQDYLMQEAVLLTAPGRLMRETSAAGNPFARLERGKRDITRKVRALLAEPGIARALGPGRTAPVVRPPARTTDRVRPAPRVPASEPVLAVRS